MIFRSRAPLRIGLAGGGTDVSPYSELYGGAVINAAISLFAYAEIDFISEKKIILYSADRNQQVEAPINEILPVNGTLDLLKGMYNRIVRDFGPFSNGIRLSTTVDAPLGSGLGTSSTLMVAMQVHLQANAETPDGRISNWHISHMKWKEMTCDFPAGNRISMPRFLAD